MLGSVLGSVLGVVFLAFTYFWKYWKFIFGLDFCVRLEQVLVFVIPSILVGMVWKNNNMMVF